MGIMTKGSRPEQAVLTKDTDMSKTAETRAVIEGMVDGLNDHRIGDIGEFFADGFRDGKHWVWYQEQLEGVPGQLAETIPGSFFRQGVHRRSPAIHGGVGRRFWEAGGYPLRRIHGDPSHRQEGEHQIHGLLESGRRENS